MTHTHQQFWRPDETGAEVLLQAIRSAFQRSEDDRRRDDGTLRPEADQRLRATVEAARDAGVEWGRIADALGTQRGNAYQRYRRRPRPAADA